MTEQASGIEVSPFEEKEAQAIGLNRRKDWLDDIRSMNERLVPLGLVYCGMGHDALIVREARAEGDLSYDGRRYKVVHMGGASAYERETQDENYAKIEKLSEPLLTLAELKARMKGYKYAEECLGLFADEP